MSVKNVTIGHKSQPGTLTVLNGSMDMYDANNKQTISSGQVVAINTRMLGQISYPSTLTYTSTAGAPGATTPVFINLASQANQKGVYVRFAFFCALVQTGNTGWNIDIFPPSGSRIQTAQMNTAWNGPISMDAVVAAESIIGGNYVVQLTKTGAADTITVNGAATAPIIFYAELV